jgi:predicted DNA-binding transcriptional regulator AlpA
MTHEQIERFNQTFPEFNNILGRSMVAWVEAEVTQKLVEQFDEIFEDKTAIKQENT